VCVEIKRQMALMKRILNAARWESPSPAKYAGAGGKTGNNKIACTTK